MTPNPGAIMNLTPHPQSGLNPATYPVDPKTCQPIMPWDYLKVNSIFQVIQNAGMRTAWSDKHAIYTSFNGHWFGWQQHRRLLRPGDRLAGGRAKRRAVPDRYATGRTTTPPPSSTTATRCRRSSTRLNGYDHSGQNKVGVPAILGMNFQTVSVAEKVDSPSTLTKNPDGTYTEGPVELAGYYPGTTTPRPLLASALDYVNAQLAADGRHDPAGRSRVLHGDHHHGQARPVAAGSATAEADRRRPDHRRDQRGLDREDG